MKLEQPCFAIDAISRLLGFGINMRKPAYATWSIFEIFAMFIQQLEVVLKIIHIWDHTTSRKTNMFVLNVRDCIGTVWFNTLRCHRWPAILGSNF